jgi:hypothetical protein
MQARQVDEMLLGLGTRCVLTNERDKITVPGQDVSIRMPSSLPAISQPTHLSISQNSRSKKEQKKTKKRRRTIQVLHRG